MNSNFSINILVFQEDKIVLQEIISHVTELGTNTSHLASITRPSIIFKAQGEMENVPELTQSIYSSQAASLCLPVRCYAINHKLRFLK